MVIFQREKNRYVLEGKVFLYLVRHAEARLEEEDPSRGLSEKGLNDIKKIASFLGVAVSMSPGSIIVARPGLYRPHRYSLIN